MAHKWMKLGDVSQQKLTPMLRQYIEAKAESGDSLLFFRMGDFYEMFFEDALESAEILGLTLTSRDGAGKDTKIPMAGVPVRTLDTYVAKVIKAGRTVAICDQVEDPKEAKGIVKRAVTRTITPGTVLEPDLLEDTANNFLAALAFKKDVAGLAFMDVTTGDFLTAQVEADPERTLIDELTRMAPVEVLIAEGAADPMLERIRARFPSMAFRTRDDDDFDAGSARETLYEHFELSTLKGVGLEDAPEALACAGAVLAYVTATQRDAVPQVRLPRRYSPSNYVVLDGNTQRNLELVESLVDKGRRGTLLSVLDRTRTSMGGRKLRHWILHPLIDIAAINERLNAVEALHQNAELRLRLRDLLGGVADLERLLARITARSGNARDIKALGRSLSQVPALRGSLAGIEASLIASLHTDTDELQDVAGWIETAIVEEPPLPIMEGELFNEGYDEELDRLRGLVKGGRDWIATLQREQSERTGIPNLKVGYNKVFGYYIEITKAHSDKVPEDYQRKQTLVNAERYITPGLKSREEEIVTAQERMQRMEYDLFVALRDRIADEATRIQATADAVATLDALLSFAEVAATKHYCKPAVIESDTLVIRDGRHPVVEDLMPRGDFVPNDIELDPATASLNIVTGPNMAGKSTYLRQVALITLMAQVGSFVPAADAQVGVVDRIFTRVGASDNLVRGESTFMVEMIETATILNTATPRSLLVLDEIGRGTSTFDGISIAWSVAEHIHDRIQAKTLFATHYHELTELANNLERAKNLNVAVREWGGKVVFLYRIVEGGADHSYGIQVAKLAGLPEAVLGRAREILESLEAGNTSALGLPEQMYLFGQAPTNEPSRVEQELEATDLDELSPREAQEFLYHLKHLTKKPRE
jgi:DNA mismatch repair protein MutS